MAVLLTPFLGSPRWGWGGHDTLKGQARGGGAGRSGRELTESGVLPKAVLWDNPEG